MRNRAQRSRVSNDRWLVSYADFITLLFGLFVVLYAFAHQGEKKNHQVTLAIDSAFHSMGFLPSATSEGGEGSGAAPAMDASGIGMNAEIAGEILSQAKVKEDLNRVRKQLEQSLAGQLAHNTVSIQMGREGLVISLREAGFFQSGSATPRPDSVVTLRQIAASLGRTPYALRVEGHTDNVPIHTDEFDSNWELSSARATRIARLFLKEKTIPADRLSAAGYAEFHPVDSNATESGRGKNRRVDLVVMPRTNIDLSKSERPRADGVWRKITEDDARALEK
jgi:chemotaxis protein MotB